MLVDEPAQEKQAQGQEQPRGQKEKPASDEDVARAKELTEKVGKGTGSVWRASKTFLQKKGKDLDEVTTIYRTTWGSP